MMLSEIIKPSIWVAGLAGFGSLAAMAPAQAFSFEDWTPYGPCAKSARTAAKLRARL